MAFFSPRKGTLVGRTCVWLACCGALFAAASAAEAQILIIDGGRRIMPPRPPIPRPTPVPSSYKIRSVDVQALVKDQAATYQISQVFQNTSSTVLEAQFVFPMPENAAISGLTLLVDGKELTGRLMKKDEARRIYEETVRRSRDPALLEYMGQGMFQTSVFPIPAHAERTVEIRYTQLLKKENGLIDLLLPIGTAKHSNHPIETLNVTVRIEAAGQIKTLYSPTHQLEIHRPDDHHAVAKLTLRNAYAQDDFRLFYGTVEGLVGMNVISYRPREGEDGYFVLLASPEVRNALAKRTEKTMVFVFDKSGSMSGKKIEQAKEALKFLIQQLQPGDTFNIVAYDSAVEAFRPELQRVDDATIKAALSFADGMYAGGSTNIDGALTTALRLLNDPKRPGYVLFMTDGLPTVGELNEQKIAAHAKQLNTVGARLFAFGVGYDVNARLLDRLANDQRGQSAYVRPNESIEAHIAALQGKIASPILVDLAVNVEYDRVIPAGSAAPISRTYPRQLTDLFQGEQLVWVGRYKYGGPIKVTLSGNVAGEKKSFAFPVTLTERSIDEANGFVEKLWATRRVGEIINDIDLHGQNKELVDELVQLSLQHGIITPYTSFLADENVNLADRRLLGVQSGERLSELSRVEGRGGVSQREFKGGLQAADKPESAGELFGKADGNRVLAAAKAASGPVAARGAGGFGGAGGGAPATQNFNLQEAQQKFAGSNGRAVVAQDAAGDLQVLEGVRKIGQKTFFRKKDQWQDSTVTTEQAKQAIRVVQFSDEYFELAAKHGGTLAKYLAFDEPVLVSLGGQAYLITVPAAE